MKVVSYISYPLNDEGYVVVPTDCHRKRSYFMFNHTAYQMLEDLHKLEDSDSVVKKMVERYGFSSESQIKEDIETLILRLGNLGFIKDIEPQKTLSNQEINSKALYSQMYMACTKAQTPFKVFLELTNNCMLKCKHCYKGSDINSDQEKTIDKKRYFKLLDELKELGVFEVNITGGEATCNPDCLDILAHASSLGFCVILLTNGINFSDSYVDELAQLGLYDIRLSFYGNEKEHDYFVGVPGSFRKTLRALETVNSKIGIGSAVYIVTNRNHDMFEAFSHQLRAQDIHVVANTMIFPTLQSDQKPLDYRLNGNERAKFLENNLTDFTGSKCSAGISRFRITPNGDVTPCEMLENILLGNVMEKSMTQTLASEARKAWIDQFTAINEDIKCSRCTNRQFCNSCIGLFRLENDSYYQVSEYLCEGAAIKRELSKNRQ